jgi:hypothetical protein
MIWSREFENRETRASKGEKMRKHWLNDLDYQKGGYYQRCTSCGWTGEGLHEEAQACPECGGALEKDAAMVLGGIIITCQSGRFLLQGVRSNAGLPYTLIDAADAPEIVEFMFKRLGRPTRLKLMIDPDA